eukprot:tig00000139_g8316.t1
MHEFMNGLQTGGDVSLFGEGFPVGQPITILIVSSTGATCPALNPRIVSTTEIAFRVPPFSANCNRPTTRGLLQFNQGTGYSLQIASVNNAFQVCD